MGGTAGCWYGTEDGRKILSNLQRSLQKSLSELNSLKIVRRRAWKSRCWRVRRVYRKCIPRNSM